MDKERLNNRDVGEFDMVGFSLKQIEVFAAVAELNSFTRAGEKLYLTQSTISAHINALERELETRLFIRQARQKIRLTPEGQRIYPAVKRILSDCQEMKDLLQDEDRELPLLLGGSTVPAQYLLPDLLSSFLKKYPDYHCLLKRGDSVRIHELLESGKIRIGFVGTLLDPQTFSYFPLIKDELVLVTENSPRFRKFQEQGALGRDLLTEPFIAREEGSGTERSVVKYLRKSGFSPEKIHVTARIDDPESIKNMVAQGAGVAILSSLAVRKEVEEGNLLSFGVEKEGLTRTIYMVCRRNVRYSHMERQFLEFTKRVGKCNSPLLKTYYKTQGCPEYC